MDLCPLDFGKKLISQKIIVFHFCSLLLPFNSSKQLNSLYSVHSLRSHNVILRPLFKQNYKKSVNLGCLSKQLSISTAKP